jgi:hypothetical protein
MTRKNKIVFWLITVLCTGAAFSQVPIPGIRTGTRAQAKKSPAAYVYVNVVEGNKAEIYAFAADSKGGLSGIPGSPFPGFADVGYWAGKNGYLFATDGTYIYSYFVSSIGAPREVAKIKAVNRGAAVSDLFLDRTAEDLYDYEYEFGSNHYYQSFRIDRSTGRLTYLGAYNVGYDSVPGGKMTFAGDNLYAYTAYNFCYFSCSWGTLGARRNSKGKLTGLNTNKKILPPTAKDGDAYLAAYAGADPTDHVAIAVQAVNQFGNDGLPQLATYAVHSDGNLTTTSAYWNMPTTANQVYDMEMSPSGQLLAVAGTAGLEVFHFNGSKPITPYTGLLTNDEIDQCFWDNDNHLYAISSKSSLLFVFTVTPTSYRQAPGSPHLINQAAGAQVIVLPMT